MAERRSLIDGVKTDEVEALKEFVFQGKPERSKTRTADDPAEATDGKATNSTTIGKSPLTTRIRSDYAAALKRASLERQLQGVVPNTLQDILEQAVEPWLRSNGYLH